MHERWNDAMGGFIFLSICGFMLIAMGAAYYERTLSPGKFLLNRVDVIMFSVPFAIGTVLSIVMIIHSLTRKGGH